MPLPLDGENQLDEVGLDLVLTCTIIGLQPLERVVNPLTGPLPRADS